VIFQKMGLSHWMMWPYPAAGCARSYAPSRINWCSVVSF